MNPIVNFRHQLAPIRLQVVVRLKKKSQVPETFIDVHPMIRKDEPKFHKNILFRNMMNERRLWNTEFHTRSLAEVRNDPVVSLPFQHRGLPE